MKEMDKLHELYDTLREAREQLGEQNIPFHKFTELVKAQVVEAEEGRRARSGVSGVGEGREAELYGEGFEGRRSKARSPSGRGPTRSGPDQKAELRVRPW